VTAGTHQATDDLANRGTFAAVSETVFHRLEKLLADRGIRYEVMHHEPVYTSQQAAAVRGTALASGAKALVVKGDDQFVMIVLPADRKLASRFVRQTCGWRKLRFATRDEVAQLTGLEPGAIPPFGSLFALATFCDTALGGNPQINFNAGDHCISVSMAYADYLAVEKPQLGTFSQPPSETARPA